MRRKTISSRTAGLYVLKAKCRSPRAGWYPCARGLVLVWILLFSPFAALSQQSTATDAAPTRSFQRDLDAATQGDVQAQLKVGRANTNASTGTGRQNYREAFKWFQMASQNGSVEAGAWLGSLYLFGQGTVADTSRGAGLIQAAADTEDPVGLRFLGVMYEAGRGATQSYPNAVKAYSRATAKGDANAFGRLGNLYLHGLGVSADPGKAFDLFTQGATLGDSWAQLDLGLMYERGIGIAVSSKSSRAIQGTDVLSAPGSKPAPDYAMAMKFYEASAAQHNRIAQFRLGQMYEQGRGTAQSYDKAFQYYELSSSHQYGPGLLALGRLHELGLGASFNLVHAYIAYSLATEQGNRQGEIRLQALLRKMTAAQIEEAHSKLKQVKIIRNQMIGN